MIGLAHAAGFAVLAVLAIVGAGYFAWWVWGPAIALGRRRRKAGRR